MRARPFGHRNNAVRATFLPLDKHAGQPLLLAELARGPGDARRTVETMARSGVPGLASQQTAQAGCSDLRLAGPATVRPGCADRINQAPPRPPEAAPATPILRPPLRGSQRAGAAVAQAVARIESACPGATAGRPPAPGEAAAEPDLASARGWPSRVPPRLTTPPRAKPGGGRSSPRRRTLHTRRGLLRTPQAPGRGHRRARPCQREAMAERRVPARLGRR